MKLSSSTTFIILTIREICSLSNFVITKAMEEWLKNIRDVGKMRKGIYKKNISNADYFYA